MALPQSAPFMWMRRHGPAFHEWASHPPVSIVVEETPVLKQNPIHPIGNLPAAIHRESPVPWRFCYDGDVWQRVAIRQGRDAVKHGRVFVKHVVPAVIKP